MTASRRSIEFQRTKVDGAYSYQIHRVVGGVGSTPLVHCRWDGDCAAMRFLFDAEIALYTGLAWRLTEGYGRLALIASGRKAALDSGLFDKKNVGKVYSILETDLDMNGRLRCKNLDQTRFSGSDSAILRIDTWDALRFCLWVPQDAYSECTVLAVKEQYVEHVEALLTRSQAVDLPALFGRTALLVQLMHGHDLGTNDAVTVYAKRDIQEVVENAAMKIMDAIALVERGAKSAATPALYQALLKQFAQTGQDL